LPAAPVDHAAPPGADAAEHRHLLPAPGHDRLLRRAAAAAGLRWPAGEPPRLALPAGHGAGSGGAGAGRDHRGEAAAHARDLPAGGHAARS
ncbi:hypothetical protein ABTB93_20485, partial [Acinetobacter baumannii]